MEDEETGMKYYKKTKGELSKNHREDSENMDNGGTMNFEENSVGFNASLFLQLFISKQHPDAQFFFSQPQRAKKDFRLRSNPSIWFEKNKIGKNTVCKALPILCEVAGVDKYNNNSIRPTAIRFLKRAKAEDREIMKFSGHKSVGTLQHYDSGMEKDRQLQLSRCIGDGFNLKNTSIPGPSRSASTSKASIMEEMMEGEVFDEQDFTQADLVASQHFGSKSGQDDSVKQKASIMEEIEGEVFDEEDFSQADLVASQHFGSNPSAKKIKLEKSETSEFLRNEQEISIQQMNLFTKQIEMMESARKMRYKLVSKKCRK